VRDIRQSSRAESRNGPDGEPARFDTKMSGS
jgi:hypothetical protein